ncbi:peroxiredoxin family protein [Nitritalea halalkaliphila]|nr:TlpA disulfide reductase family protein [Nitritalea halalkaliphila]
MKKQILGLLILVVFGCKPNMTDEYFLQKIVENLNEISSVSYFEETISSAPGDTIAFTEAKRVYHKVIVNSLDSLVGASSFTFLSEDTTKMTDFYDGQVRGKVNWAKQTVKVDSFVNNPHPFRLVYYPFYTKINSILKYALTTEDDIQVNFEDYGDSLYFRLKIIDKHVYFHINPITIKNEYIPEDEISQFDIWFNKKDLLPYRMESKWHHVTLFQSVYSPNLNFSKAATMHAREYFPSYFSLQYFDRDATRAEGQVGKKQILIGEIAPDWVLQDVDYNIVKLSDLKSKVLLIQFTGIGCGPCHLSIPFLKSLAKKYEDQDFELLSLETWSNNLEGLKRYQQKNDLNFKFLKSSPEVTASYGVPSVPVFFVIDENRVIREVITGYSKGETDKEILETNSKSIVTSCV